MAVDFTVAIPTYNGAERLPKVLDKLRSQVKTENISWEVIVIDNNSTDNTAEIIRNYQADWSATHPLRYCTETRQGIAYARQRAVEQAQGIYIGFLDDDNLPASDWVATAYAFGQEHPRAGAYGGQIHGDFEVQPPEDFQQIQAFLVIRKYGEQAKQFEPEKLRLPAGAGLVVRKQAWLDSVPTRLVRTARGGNDYEISLHLHKGGWEIWYNPIMHIYHQIPPWRLEKRYLLSLAHLYGSCTCELRMINTQTWQKPVVLARSFVGSLRRATLHLIRHRGKLKTDLGAACEMAFFLGNLESPFYYLGKVVKNQLYRNN
jgi:GT2 family glycosyltransferase